MRGKNMSLHGKVVLPPSGSFNISFVLIMILFAGTLAFLSNNKSRPLLKFCFNSRDQFVQAQCVLCDFYSFSATVLDCNGRTSALMSNISSTEAVCIISNCLQQIRQTQPQLSGRKRRDAIEYGNKTPAEIGDDFDRQDIIDEKTELAAASPTMKEFLSRYVMMNDEELKELEDRVVDRIEVSVGAQDYDYDI